MKIVRQWIEYEPMKQGYHPFHDGYMLWFCTETVPTNRREVAKVEKLSWGWGETPELARQDALSMIGEWAQLISDSRQEDEGPKLISLHKQT